MPLAVTHVLLTVILVGLYRDHVTRHKRYFTLHTIFIAGIAGLISDIDIPIRIVAQLFNWQVYWLFQHGGITHTPLFALIFFIPAIILWKRKKHKQSMYLFVITFGIMFHIFLDYFLGGGDYYGIMWLFPFSLIQYKIHLLDMFGLNTLPESMDALLLLGWLYYIEVKHKISNFI
ncbi:MAG: metal-dependent hydrolase [Nanoarchaeota archaeon]|nr:metal-dependent hydrolase [Nanoarchaeota archaeon]MBU1704018.1 metal-dependent hydrolase [Nanoarchaeota archaeon]